MPFFGWATHFVSFHVFGLLFFPDWIGSRPWHKDGPRAMIQSALLYGGFVYLLSGNLALQKKPFQVSNQARISTRGSRDWPSSRKLIFRLSISRIVFLSTKKSPLTFDKERSRTLIDRVLYKMKDEEHKLVATLHSVAAEPNWDRGVQAHLILQHLHVLA